MLTDSRSDSGPKLLSPSLSRQVSAWLGLHLQVLAIVVVDVDVLMKSREKQISSADWLTHGSVGVAQV